MTLSKIRARIGVSRLVLEQYARTDRWYQCSHVQSTALISLIQTLNGVDAPTLADLCQLAGAVQWAGQDGQKVLEAFSTAMLPAATRDSIRARRPVQNYKSCLEYFEQREWNQLFDRNCTAGAKLDIIIQKIVKLGGRTIDEPSSKLGTSAYLMLTETPDKLFAMSETCKNAVHNYLKSEFKRKASKSHNALTHMLELPPSPSTLLVKHPAIYREAFLDSDTKPVPCQLPLHQLTILNASYACRLGSHSAPQKRVRSSLEAPTMHAGGFDSGVVCSLDTNGVGLGNDGRSGGVDRMIGMFDMAMRQQMQQMTEGKRISKGWCNAAQCC